MMLLAETIEAKFEFPEKLSGLDGWLEMGEALFTNYPLLGVLIILIFIDVVTGVLASWIAGNISSVASHKGMIKKGVMLLVIGTARVMELVIPQAPLMSLGCFGFILVELTSIIENCGKAGVPLPPRLRRAFEKFREEEELKDKNPTVVEVNMEKTEDVPPGMRPSKFKRKSDVAITMKDSGVVEIDDGESHSKVIIPSQIKGQKGDTGEQGEKGDKGDRGDSYPPSKGA